MAEVNTEAPVAALRAGESVRTIPAGGLDPIIVQARERWKHCKKWEGDARKKFLEDYKFANADSDNGYQWPNKIREAREIDQRPCLTINKVRQHNLQIKNDAKKNRPGIKFTAAGGGASYHSAQIYTALARHIEYTSSAEAAYDQARGFMVDAGWGYLRLTTDFCDNTSWNQDIFIKGSRDPLSCYLDPDAKEPDKSDAEYGFAFDDVYRKDFPKRYSKYAEIAANCLVGDEDGWIRDDYVRLCEYFRKERVADVLYAVVMQDGSTVVLRHSEIKENKVMLDYIRSRPDTKKRDIDDPVVMRYVIVGDRIAKKERWAGSYIPIIKMYAEETIIEGNFDCKSHTRSMIDPQRMYNYWASMGVEYGGLQSKSPYIAPAESIEGLENYWETANTVNHSVLPYNGMDDAGNKIEAPKRQEPPVAAPVAIQGMQIAQAEFGYVSGQYETYMGDKGNERTGKALSEREHQGQRSTFHYTTAEAMALRLVGRQILELIPKIFDVPRTLQILAEDGTTIEVQIDPKAKAAYEKKQLENQQDVQRIIFNPMVGKYEVHADIGPSYGTRREEAWNAFSLLLTQAPALTNIIGDLLMKAGDFPLAEEAAQRLRRMVPPAALGEGPSVNEQQLTMQLEQLKTLLQTTMEELTKEKVRAKGIEQKRDIEAFKALTSRLQVLLKDENEKAAAQGQTARFDMGQLDSIIDQLTGEILSSPVEPIVSANAPQLEQQRQLNQQQLDLTKPPIPGARMSTNGQWYARDYSQNPNMWPVTPQQGPQ